MSTRRGGGRIVHRARSEETAPGVLGRDRELRQLEEGLQEALEGRGRLFVVSGDPGIGKTTLARAFADRASEVGLLAAWGRCWESGGAPPLWPWTQVLRSCVAEPTLRTVARELPDAAATVVSLAAGAGARRTQPEDLIGSEEARFAVFDSVVRYLQHGSHETPLLLVLEDLHAGDVASLMMLKLLARQVAGLRGVVVATYRRGEARRNSEVMRELVDVGREGDVLDLHGLDRDALSMVIERTTGLQPTDPMVNRILQLTGGNPLFAEELSRVLGREASISEAGAASEDEPVALPDSVRETVARRVDQLEPRSRACLEVAAVIGPQFDLRVVADVLGLAGPDLAGVIEELEGEDLIAEVSGSLGRYAFSHALLREALYDRIPPRLRAELHGVVGGALDRLGGVNADDRLGEVAHHLTESLRGGVAPPEAAARAFDRSVRAGERARQLLAFEDSVELFERALEIAATTDVDPRRRVEALIALGESRIAVGRADDAVSALEEAADLARDLDAADLLARAAIALGEKPSGGMINPDLVAMIEEALQRVPQEDSEERARLLARLGLELLTSPDESRRHGLVRDGVAIARRVGSPRTLAVALNAKGFALHSPDVIEESLDAATELLEIGRRLHDPALQAAAYSTRLYDLLQLGRGWEFQAEIRELERAASASRQALHVWCAAVVRATRAAMRGDFDDADRLSKEALAAGGSLPGAMPTYLNQTFATGYHRGVLETMEGPIRALRDERPAFRSMWSATLALILAEAGRGEEAMDELRTFVAELPATPRGAAWLVTLAWAADACDRIGDRDSASALYDALLPYAHLHAALTVRVPASYWGAVELRLGRLAALAGRPEEAVTRLDRALDTERRLGALPFVAQAEMSLARTLLDTAADAERAAALVRSATQTADRLGMRVLAARVAELNGYIEAGVVELAAASGPEFRLEAEFWTVSYGGGVSRFKDTKGFRYLETLLRGPAREHHVLDLFAGGAQPRERTAVDAAEARQAGLRAGPPLDTGQVLDPEARAAYKRRLADLREEVEQAESWRDAERAARAGQEIEVIERELSRAFGLGGRGRVGGSAAEQARVNVTKAIRAALRKVDQANPALGRHFRDTVKTGTYCSYGEPGEQLPAWRLG